jgi:hypothetical protein
MLIAHGFRSIKRVPSVLALFDRAFGSGRFAISAETNDISIGYDRASRTRREPPRPPDLNQADKSMD